MSTKFTYALILTFCGAAFSLVLFFLGYETEKIALLQKLSWLGLLYQLPVLWLGLRAVRDEAGDAGFSYGRGVGTGTLISLYAGLLGGVYRFIHLKFINTNFADYQMEFVRQQWAQAGMSDAQMAQAEPVTRMFMGPVAQAIMTPIFGVIFGVILSLILAAFLRRAPSEPATV